MTTPITICNRFTDEVIYTAKQATDIRGAVIEAVKARANLADADLAGADLADANLARAYLAGADLARAYLAGADLARANLAGADLARANLAGAYLARAYLAGANLAGANLARAYLAGADLARAYLAGADLARANLAGADLADANLAGAKNAPEGFTQRATEPLIPAPVIPNIHRTLLAAVTAAGCSLDMRQWHTCDTAHCRAGWVVHLAGETGRALELEVGTARAAARIYRASDPGCRVPHWYASNDRAMADIRACAEREAAAERA